MSNATHVPTIVIGAGSAGLTVANSLAALGKQVLLIEKHQVGGDCTNVGCIPSKTLIHLAEAGRSYDPATILATVQAKRDHLRDEETATAQHTDHLTLIQGYARFRGPKRLNVSYKDGTTRAFTADKVVIATGSRPRTLAIPGLPRERTLTNETVFELPDAPRHLAIIGSGPIGIELAGAFRKLGSRVTLVTLDPRVLQQGSVEASATLHAALVAQDIAVFTGSSVDSYTEATQTLRITTPGGARTIDAVDRVLLAVGRVRNVDTLDLEQAGVMFDRETGIPVDRHNQTNVPGIYAIGDVTPDSQWTHSANAQGRRVVQHILFPYLPTSSRLPLYPNATFSDPEVANVGLLPEQIAQRYHPQLVTTLRWELAKTDKGYTENLAHGFVQVYALRLSGRMLGATIVGPRASEMISFFTLAITERISLYKLFRLVYPYPTLSGAIQKIADEFVRKTLPNLPAELRAVARYGAATIWGRLRGASFEAAWRGASPPVLPVG